MQKKLSQWAIENPGAQYRELYHLLCNEVWLRVAHHTVNTNQGRETAGIDGESMSNFNGNLEGNLEELRQLLRQKPLSQNLFEGIVHPKSNGKKDHLVFPVSATGSYKKPFA